MAKKKEERYEVRGEDVVKKIKEIIHEGNVRRIIIQDMKGKVIVEFPLTIGVVGVLLAPILAAAGAIAAIATKCTIIVEKRR